MGAAMVVGRQTAFVWTVWSEAHVSWAVIAVSEKREAIHELHERFSSVVDLPSAVVVAASAEDDDVEAAVVKLPFPAGYAGLQHERWGVE